MTKKTKKVVSVKRKTRYSEPPKRLSPPSPLLAVINRLVTDYGTENVLEAYAQHAERRARAHPDLDWLAFLCLDLRLAVTRFSARAGSRGRRRR